MMGKPRVRNLLAACCWAPMLATGGVDGQEITRLPGDPTPVVQEPATVRLRELLALAQERSPRVQAARLLVDAARAREPAAGLLPDPTLQVGFMNLALPEFSATMPASMAPSFTAMQRFPIAGKLSLQEEIARRSTEIDDAAAGEVWWMVRAEVAGVFYGLYRMDRQIEVMEGTLELLQDFQAVATSLYSTGVGRQADVLRAGVEVARMEADILRMASGRRRTAARLNALIKRPADTPVPTPELDPLPL